MWPFRRSQIPSNGPGPSQTTLDLIEQVTMLRGQVRAMETEWDDIRVQIKKGFQRMEKANTRAERRSEEDGEPQVEKLQEPEVPTHGHPFVRKLEAMRGK